jgi:hypothetical protein
MHLILLGLYFLPAIVAASRHTHNATGIFMLNLFLGWTGIGWVIALCLALFSHSYYYCCGPHRWDPQTQRWT